MARRRELAKVDANLEKILADQLPRIAHVGDKAPSGEFALAATGNLQLHEKADGVAIAEQGDAASPLANLAYASLPAQMNRAGDRRFMERLQMAAAVPEKKKVGVAAPVGGGGGAGGGPAKVVPARSGPAAVEREFAHVHVPGLPADTLLWHPNLWLKAGVGEVHFEVGSGQATYRVLLLGHGPDGRLGFFETRLDATGSGR